MRAVAWRELDVWVTALFCADLAVKSRTTFSDHGYNVAEPRKIISRYARCARARPAGSRVRPDVSRRLPPSLAAARRRRPSPTFGRLLPLLVGSSLYWQYCL